MATGSKLKTSSSAQSIFLTQPAPSHVFTPKPRSESRGDPTRPRKHWPAHEKKSQGLCTGVKFFKALCCLARPVDKYKLRVPETYCSEENKLLVFNPSKGYLTEAISMSEEVYKSRLEAEARKKEHLDEAAYTFYKVNIDPRNIFFAAVTTPPLM